MQRLQRRYALVPRPTRAMHLPHVVPASTNLGAFALRHTLLKKRQKGSCGRLSGGDNPQKSHFDISEV